jgi:enoyl-CoA hydratase/carnithine racemase
VKPSPSMPESRSDELLVTSQYGRTRLVTFNRPARRNGWTYELEAAYFAALIDAEADPDVRVIVLHGAGGNFCVGGDTGSLDELVKSGGERPAKSHRYWLPLTLKKPVLAAIDGACAGAGFLIAMFCDARFSATDAKFTTAFARRGLIAENGIAWILPRVVGHGRAWDLLATGRVFDGVEAEHLGVVAKAVAADDVLAHTLDYAEALSTRSAPVSIASIKAQLLAAWNLDVAAADFDADRRTQASLASASFREGVRSFIEKRAPNFPDDEDTSETEFPIITKGN